jgi:hypothetical protein
MPLLARTPAALSLARLINTYASTWDAVAAAIGVAGDASRPSDEQMHVAHDQRLKALDIAGLHSRAEELSTMRRNGNGPTTPQR